MQDYPEILTVAHVAYYLQICKKSVYRLVKERTLSAFRIMDKLRFTGDGADTFTSLNQAIGVK